MAVYISIPCTLFIPTKYQLLQPGEVECRKFGTECTRNLIQLVALRGADALDMYGHHLARMILQSNTALCQKARMRKQDLKGQCHQIRMALK